MIAVPLTENNWEIYQELLALDKDFQKGNEVERKAIIAMANALCEKLEMDVI